MSLEKVKKLIRGYQAEIEHFLKCCDKEFGGKNLLRAWRQGEISQQGKLSNGTEYELHGIGCRFFYSGGEVDFDFGSDARSDGFDLWRLSEYLEYNPSRKYGLTKEGLRKDFVTLVETGCIAQLDENSNLYFFSDDI